MNNEFCLSGIHIKQEVCQYAVVQFNLLILFELFGLLVLAFMIFNEIEAVNRVISIHIAIVNMDNKYT